MRARLSALVEQVVQSLHPQSLDHSDLLAALTPD
jgi:hypothetical protein